MEVDVDYDPETETYQTVHDFSANVPLSTTVVLAVEQVVGEFDAVLNNTIDPDALDAVFRPRSDVSPYRRGYVEFVFAECLIAVRSDGVIEIDPSGSDDTDC